MAASENMHKGEIDALTRVADEIRTVEVLASLADDPEHRAYAQHLAGQLRDMLDQLTTQQNLMGAQAPWWIDWQARLQAE